MALDIDAVTELLKSAEQSIKKIDIHEYSEQEHITNFITQVELNDEINYLKTLVKNPESFEEQFKERCAWREATPDECINFSNMPLSPCNQLYWNIALMVFNPKTMGEMLQILSPQVTQHMHAELPDTLPTNTRDLPMKEWIKFIRPQLTLNQNLDALSEEPDIESFAHYIIADTIIFNVHDIANYNFNLHNNFKSELVKYYPTIDAKLYVHNASFETLASDLMHIAGQDVQTPKQALSELCKWLAASSGPSYAYRIIDIAIKRFFEYFRTLPEDRQNEIRNLEHNNISLAFVFNAIERGTCTASSSNLLAAFLSGNETPCLIEPNTINPELPAIINKKYKKLSDSEVIDTKVNPTRILFLPSIYAREILNRVTYNHDADLLAKFVLNQPNAYIITMLLVMDGAELMRFNYWAHLFSPEQKSLYYKTLLDNFEHFSTLTEFNLDLKNILSDRDIQGIFSSYTEQQKMDIFKKSSPNGKLFMHMIALDIVFSNIKNTEENIHDLVYAADAEGKTMIFHRNSATEIQTLLSKIPQKRRLDYLLQTDVHNMTALDYILQRHNNSAEILAVLDALDEEECNDLTIKQNIIAKAIEYSCMTALPILLVQQVPETRLFLVNKAIEANPALARKLIKDIFMNPTNLRIFLSVFPNNEGYQWIHAQNLSNNSGLRLDNASFSIYLFDFINVVRDNLQNFEAVNILKVLVKGADLSSENAILQSGLLAPKEKAILLFEIKLEQFRVKADELRDRGYFEDYTTALNLIKELEVDQDKLNSDEYSLQEFTNSVHAKIIAGKEALNHHRGIKEVLYNIGLLILGCGVFYLAACAVNRGFFRCNTDTGTKLDSMENSVRAVTVM